MQPFRRSYSSCAFLALSALASASVVDTTPPVFLTAPTITPNPNPAAPLTARLQVTTDEPTKVDIFVREATRSFRFTPSESFSTTHDLPLIGFRPGRTQRINVWIRDASGNRTPWTGGGFTFTTPPLPAAFPLLRVATSQPALMEPGVTLAAMRWTSPTSTATGTKVVYLDNTGQVVWLYETPIPYRDAIRMRNGHMLASANNRLAQEIDLYGNIVTQWWAARTGTAGAPPGAIFVDCDSFHHEMTELPEGELGDFIALSTELRTYPNYPTSETDPTQTAPTANVVGDVVVEFKRDGTLVREVKLIDLLDPYRICYGSLSGVYNPLYGGVTTYDWGHSNAAIVDVADDAWVVSLRHQDAVVKVRRGDHSIAWIHGPPDRWVSPWTQYLLTPIGSPFAWNYHEHSPDFDSAGNLTMFDNGNYRATPPVVPAPTSQWYSRAVRFHVDPVAMTTQQTWEYQGATPFFSGQFGDADPQPTTHNILIADGAKPDPSGANLQYSRIVEVTSGTPSQVVYEVIINDLTQPGASALNWNLYRAERYRGVYPHQ